VPLSSLTIDTAAGGTADIRTFESGGVHEAVTRFVDNNGKTISRYGVSQGSAGNTVIIAASPGNKHKVIGGVVSLSAAGSIKFLTASTDISGAMPLAANGGFVLPPSPHCAWLETNENEALSYTTVTGLARGFLLVVTEP
jgi:hypothetical protein